VINLFPEISFDVTKFRSNNRHWHDATIRRGFLETFAETRRFDPLIPENWYSITPAQFCAQKKSSSVLSYHGGSLSNALIDLFPEVKFDHSRFSLEPRG